MLAPDGAEVAAQEWDALVVVVVEAIGPLAAVDPGDDKVFFYINHTYLSLFKMMFFCFQIWPPCSHWAQTHCGEPFLPNQLAGKVSLILPKYLTPVPF